MKKKNVTAAFLLTGSLTTPLFAADSGIEVQLLGAHGTLDPANAEYTGSTVGLASVGTGSIRNSVTAPGVGVKYYYALSDAARIAAEIDYVYFDEGEGKPRFQDGVVGANAALDVYRDSGFSFYGLGGISYHMVDTDNLRIAGELTTIDKAYLYNYDLSIGARMDFAQSTRFDVAYRYSDSFQTDDVAIETSSNSASVKGQYKKLALRTNSVVAALGYQF